MIRRSSWLLASLALGFGVPFWAFAYSGFELLPAILVSAIGLVAAAWCVRQSQNRETRS
jgi:asparagine N-glycosylation enzyme membrane subunit Stt3